MRKRKINPNSFESHAEAKAKLIEGRIDLRGFWNGEEVELDPNQVKTLQNQQTGQ